MPLLSAVISPDKELNKSEKATLEVRLDRIMVGHTKANKTHREEWVGRTLALIPTPVGRILAAPSLPTISRLRSLEWENTINMGVYTWILTPKFHNPFYPERYVHIGFATKYG